MKVSKKIIGGVTALAACALVVLFQNCSKGGSSSSTDPVIGNWEYDLPGSTSTSAKALALNLDNAGNVTAATVYGYRSGNSVVLYYRKNVGTYTRSGNVFTFTYSYETCNPVGSEQFTIQINSSNSNQLLVSDSQQGVSLTMNREAAGSGNSNISAAAIEDKGCTIVSKLEAKTNRLPASVKDSYLFLFGHQKKDSKK
jgi:hypothetical protein